MRERLLSLFKRDQEIWKIAKHLPTDILEEFEQENDSQMSKEPDQVQ